MWQPIKDWGNLLNAISISLKPAYIWGGNAQAWPSKICDGALSGAKCRRFELTRGDNKPEDSGRGWGGGRRAGARAGHFCWRTGSFRELSSSFQAAFEQLRRAEEKNREENGSGPPGKDALRKSWKKKILGTWVIKCEFLESLCQNLLWIWISISILDFQLGLWNSPLLRDFFHLKGSPTSALLHCSTKALPHESTFSEHQYIWLRKVCTHNRISWTLFFL